LVVGKLLLVVFEKEFCHAYPSEPQFLFSGLDNFRSYRGACGGHLDTVFHRALRLRKRASRGRRIAAERVGSTIVWRRAWLPLRF